ncbi:HNH endonuclease [Adonisia turfae]|nr:HNH endonuclease [Adonisia turfae]
MTKSSIRELQFDLKDTEIFKIPDTKTRLDTLQKYFFPRLEILMDNTLKLVQKIYQLNPYEDISFSYRPRHRQNSKSPVDRWGDVYLGILGRKISGKKTTLKNKNGKFYSYYYGNLAFCIDPEGCISTQFFGCNFDVTQNLDFYRDLKSVFSNDFRDLQSILMMNHLSCNSYFQLIDFCDWFDEDNSLSRSKNGELNVGFFSDLYYFPLDFNRGLKRLKLAFVALYPIFNSVRLLQQGESCHEVSLRMSEMLSKYRVWCNEGGYHNEFYEKVDSGKNSETLEVGNLLELDSYTFTRAGLWWDVLARDNWTCCSCGRSTKLHGITLHVDHILPRSKGGTDHIDNLQALCSKCNIGKSNKDSTNLRLDHCS